MTISEQLDLSWKDARAHATASATASATAKRTAALHHDEHVAGTPYKYHHGWVLIGPAYPGKHVSHPDLGDGVIKESLNGKVNVDFGSAKVQFDRSDFNGGTPDLQDGLHRRVDPPTISPPIDDADFYASLTSDQTDAVADYISPKGSEAINGALRAGKMPGKSAGSTNPYGFYETPVNRADEVKTLDSLIAAHTVTSPGTLYRGMALSPALAAQLKPGAVFTDKGFTSTSSTLDWAQKFATLRTTGQMGADSPTVKALGGKPVVMAITVPAGSHIGPGEPDIGEYVLPRGGQYRVDSVSPDGSTYNLTAVLPTPQQLIASATPDNAVDVMRSLIAGGMAPKAAGDAVSAQLKSQGKAGQALQSLKAKGFANPTTGTAAQDAARAARLAWTEDEIEVQPPVNLDDTLAGTIGRQFFDLVNARAHATASATASATAKRTAALHAREDWMREIRAPDGRWITGADRNDKLTNAATGRAARAVRVHDVVLYNKTELALGGFGLQVRMVPMEVTRVTHHSEGTGKTRSGTSRRHRFTDLVLTDPETGDTKTQSLKDGTPVRLFPREHVRAMGGTSVVKPPADDHADFRAKVNQGAPARRPAAAPPPPEPVTIGQQVAADAAAELTGAAVHDMLGTPALTPEQKAAFDKYQDPKGKYVNDVLHEGAEADGQVAAMDSVFANAKPTASPAIVYRSMNAKRVPAVGETFTNSGFVSTTTEQAIAANYGGSVVRVTVPAGSRAISVARLVGEDPHSPLTSDALGVTDKASGDEVEREVLLARGSTFRVTAKSGKGIDVELQPPAAAPPKPTAVPQAAPEPVAISMAPPGDYAGAPDVTQKSLDEARQVVDTTGLSPTEHEVLARELARNLDQVPGMQGVLKHVNMNEHLGATAITGPDEITFNPKYVHDPGLLNRGEKNWQDTGFTVPDPGAAGPYAGLRAVITHEFGHAVTWKAAHNKTPAGNAITQRALAGAIAGHPFPSGREGLKQAQAVLSDHDVVGTTVSKYAASSWPELSAESYAAWSMGGHGKAADAGAALVATLGHATPTHCKGLPKPDDDVTAVQPGAVTPAALAKTVAKGVPDPSNETGQRLIRLWSNTTIGFRYLGNEHLAMGTRANDFGKELHRMLTSSAPPASNSTGTKDAHKFMQMIDAYAAPQETPLYRGLRLDAGQAGQLFPPGGTVDLPVASFTTDAKLAERYTKNTQASDAKNPVVLTVEQGAKGLDLGSTSAEHQVLSGGRFRVSSSSTSGATTYVTLTQQDFSAH